MSACVTANSNLFQRLEAIPLRTRLVNPQDFHPCVRYLLEVLCEERRTVGDVLSIMRTWEIRGIDMDVFNHARVELLTALLVANQETLLGQLHAADQYTSLGAVLDGDPVWEQHVAEEEVPEDVDTSAAQAIAVILLTVEV